MDRPRVVPVVLSGGSGTRLWPASRPDTPKQLLALVDERTMLHATLDRVVGLDDHGPPIVVCSERQESIVRSELERAGGGDGLVIVEPVARNTAPAAAVAALAAQQQQGDPILLVMPADHVIKDVAAFHRSVQTAIVAAQTGRLVAFGIVPDHAATGYGYVELGAEARTPRGSFELARFVEKPSRQQAEKLLASGGYLWNSGMFVFKASVYLSELERCDGAMALACREAVAGATTDAATGALRLAAAAFAASPADSIDYAVMEKTNSGAVVPLDAGWSDVGSWASLHDVADKDEAGNAVFGDVVHTGVAGSYLRSEGPLLTVVGLSNVVAVSTPDAVLVAHMDRTQDVRTIVAKLNERGRSESERAKRSPAAWGTTERLTSSGERIVDELTIRPGHAATVSGDAVVVLSGSVKCDGRTAAAGAVWECGDEDIELENEAEVVATVLVVYEA